MKNPVPSGKRKAFAFGLLTIASFSATFILAPLGNFTIWITVGATVYFLFMTIYSRVPDQPPRTIRRKRMDPKDAELRAYVKRHTAILIGMFLVAMFLVLIFLLFIL